MCLNVVTDYTPKQPKVGLGWKVVYLYSNFWITITYNADKRRQYNRWVADTQEGNILPNFGIGEYKTGFHIFTRYEDARKWCSSKQIARVRYKNVVCVGLQKGMKVIVARKILVLKPKKARTKYYVPWKYPPARHHDTL